MARILKKVRQEWVADTQYHPWCGSSYDTQHLETVTSYFCSNCNKTISSLDNFCRHCGEKFDKRGRMKEI